MRAQMASERNKSKVLNESVTPNEVSLLEFKL